VTGLAWANEHTLISTGAGDAVLIWQLDPAAQLLPESASTLAAADLSALALAAAVSPTANGSSPASNMTEVFDSFHSAEPGLLQQSLEASAGLLQVNALARGDTDTVLAHGVVIDTLSTEALKGAPTQQSTANAAVKLLVTNQHQLSVGIVDDSRQHETTTAAAAETQPTVGGIPVSVNAGAVLESKAGSATEAQLTVERVVGCNEESAGTCAWLADTGVLVYAADQFLVVEQLANREQR